jgi:hypothetical protein
MTLPVRDLWTSLGAKFSRSGLHYGSGCAVWDLNAVHPARPGRGALLHAHSQQGQSV